MTDKTITANQSSQRGLDLWLLGLCSSRVFTYMIFLTYAAALPVLQAEWEMSAARAGSISSGFRIAYAVSLVIFSELADRMGPKKVFLFSNSLCAIISLLFALLARGYLSGLLLYTLIGFSLGGSYTTGIMLIANRYPVHIRGSAVGFFISSTSLSYALSLWISGMALPLGSYQLSFLLTSLGPLIGAIIIWITLSRTRISIAARSREQRFSLQVLRNRPAMLYISGYTFHSWELLGMWTWTPAFMAASVAAIGSGTSSAAGVGASRAALFHLVAILAPLSMGALSDRLGRALVILMIGSLSTVCSFTLGWMIGLPVTLIVIVGMVYAFSGIGDSPVLSAGLTESVDPSYMGAAFALRSFLGFGAGAVSDLVFGAVLDLTNPSYIAEGQYGTWGWAFGMLGLGGLGAVISASLLLKKKGVAS